MTLMTIKLEPIPKQSQSFMLNGAAFTIDVLTRRGRLYISVWRAGSYILRERALLSYAPVGFGLQLVDTEGTEDPVYTGLGSRWVLLGLQA